MSEEWTQTNGMGGVSDLMRELKRIETGIETYYYANAKVNDTVADHEEYLRRYPRGEHFQEIKQLLNDLEDSYYAKAKDGKDFDASQEYLTKFVNGRYVPEVTGWLNRLYATMIEFVSVKGGCYPMGDTFGDGGRNEKPFHEVCVDDFSMGKYNVTIGDFKKFVKETGYRTEAEMGGGCYDWAGKKNAGLDWRNTGFAQDDRHPVVRVSYGTIRWLLLNGYPERQGGSIAFPVRRSGSMQHGVEGRMKDTQDSPIRASCTAMPISVIRTVFLVIKR